jgi:hypothetical protein
MAKENHEKWTNGAQDWKRMSQDEARKWIFFKLRDFHNPKDWLLKGAKQEDAKNIGALLLRTSSHRIAKALSRAFFPEEQR